MYVKDRGKFLFLEKIISFMKNPQNKKSGLSLKIYFM